MKVLHLTDTHKGLTSRTSKIHEKWIKQLQTLEFDALVHTGDHASSKQDEVRRSFKMCRHIAGDRPVLTVRGNHDLWNDPKVMPWDAHEQQRAWAEEHRVHLLSEWPFLMAKDDRVYAFFGWDGWYATKPISNDFNWMPREHPEGFPMHNWLKANEYRQLDVQLEWARKTEAHVKIAVTHFPIHPELPDRSRRHPMSASGTHFEAIKDVGATVLLYGHTHRGFIAEIEGVLCHNPGSDYDKPVGMVIDLCDVYSKSDTTNLKAN